MSDFETLAAIVLALLVLITLVAEVWRPRTDSKLSKLVRLVLLLASVGALYLLIFPPLRPVPAQTLVVLSAESAFDPTSLAANERAIALPEATPAGSDAAVVRVADLASALRQFPAATGLRIVGAGLGPRDLATAASLPVASTPPPSPDGVIELTPPPPGTPGSLWSVSGRVHADAATQLQLFDPQGELVSSARLNADGRFQLHAITSVAGSFNYGLSLLDAEDREIDSLTVPVVVLPTVAQRLLLWSRAPNPETKYLRRWALDAGLQLNSIVSLRPRLSVRLGDPQLSAANLAETDLLIIDDRSWNALSSAERAAVTGAVSDGLGLLLRLTDEPEPAAQQRLAELGFAVTEDADLARVVRLPARGPALEPAADAALGPALQRRMVQVSAAQSRALLVDESGVALGRWRALGSGRVGLLWLSDTHRLHLIGKQSRYASLWASLVHDLARATGESPIAAAAPHHWVDQRVSWCGLGGSATVIAPDQSEIELVGTAQECAAYWPAQSGWHRLRSGEREAAFYVREKDDGAALRQQHWIDQNRSLSDALVDQSTAAVMEPGPRWPWWLLWLGLSGGLWWMERRATAAQTIA